MYMPVLHCIALQYSKGHVLLDAAALMEGPNGLYPPCLVYLESLIYWRKGKTMY